MYIQESKTTMHHNMEKYQNSFWGKIILYQFKIMALLYIPNDEIDDDMVKIIKCPMKSIDDQQQ